MKSDPEKGSMKPAPLLFSSRLTLFIVCMFSSFVFLIQRMNISFALVCMVKRPNITSTDAEHTVTNLSSVENFDLENIFGNISSVESLGVYDDDSDAVCRRMAANRANSSKVPFIDEGEFEWSKDVQGAILASFYYGYLFTQIFGGWLAERFGAKKNRTQTTGKEIEAITELRL